MYKQIVLMGAFTYCAMIAVFGVVAPTAQAAYHHMGEMDSDYFLEAYPDTADTKLDSCTLCHRGGSYSSGSKTVTLGSCQWCHYDYGYDKLGDINRTLNPYGKDYRDAGSGMAGAVAIENDDSDGDGFTNREEIAALRFPGDPADDPTKVPAPYAVYDLKEIEAMPAHTQFMLMNTHKSGDFYTEYTGVTMAYLVEKAGVLPSAAGIDVYAPDGFSTFHPLDAMEGFYHVRGAYPNTVFYYNEEADAAVTSYGWCDYSALSALNRKPGDPILVDGGPQMLLTYKREGRYLDPGQLDASNKLDGEGPFRVVPPQRIAGPPDQSSKSLNQDVIWPFDEDENYTDHNAGFSTKSATIIKVGPLPEGTTDIDTIEAGWNYVDQTKIVIYGAIDPIPTVLSKLEELEAFVSALHHNALRRPEMGAAYARKIDVIVHQIGKRSMTGATAKIAHDLLPKVNGAALLGAPDNDDWVVDPTAQLRIYWSLKELQVLMEIGIDPENT